MTTENEHWVSHRNLIREIDIKTIKYREENVYLAINYDILVFRYRCRIKVEHIFLEDSTKDEYPAYRVEVPEMIWQLLSGHHKDPDVVYGYSYEGPCLTGNIVRATIQNNNSKNRNMKNIKKLSKIVEELEIKQS